MLNNIGQRIVSLEYGINKIGTLVIFVPIVSLITHKLKTSDFQKKIDNAVQENQGNPDLLMVWLNSREFVQLDEVNKWHALGGIVQTIFFVALGILINPVFLIPSFFAMYEAYSAANGLKVDLTIQNSRLNFNW